MKQTFFEDRGLERAARHGHASTARVNLGLAWGMHGHCHSDHHLAASMNPSVPTAQQHRPADKRDFFERLQAAHGMASPGVMTKRLLLLLLLLLLAGLTWLSSRRLLFATWLSSSITHLASARQSFFRKVSGSSSSRADAFLASLLVASTLAPVKGGVGWGWVGGWWGEVSAAVAGLTISDQRGRFLW